MPRIARVTTENGCYHIISRGNQKQPVFLKGEDYEKYLSLLYKYKERYNFKLYSFCLMPNHVHLVIEVGIPSLLKKVLHGLNLSYSQYFNFKYDKVGHLWQDRFKSRLIEKDNYLLGCINYIENNPLRAGLVSRIKEYPWSSYIYRQRNISILDNPFIF